MKIYVNSATIDRFINSELSKWPLAATNYEALKLVETKFFDVDGLRVKVQYNPARRVSTGAKIDAKSIKERPCFLCRSNRQPEQSSLHWGASYEFLVNPFPIFPKHLTIPNVRHVPQTVRGRIGDLIEITRDLENYAIFYNGPRCGASAPDHMHFQGCPKTELPLIAAIEERMPATTDSIELQASLGFPFGFFIIDVFKRASSAAVDDTVKVLAKALLSPTIKAIGDTEPMVNIICYNSGDTTRIVIIPRRKHRPSNYGEGEGQMLISPASVDLGGVLITPRKEDFDHIKADDIRRIYAECCFTESDILEVIDSI